MKPTHRSLLIFLLGTAVLAGTAQSAEIHDAAEADDIVHIQALLATNATLVNLPGNDELTPLHAAARQGKLKAVAALLEHGAAVNAKDIHGCTPLHSAVYGNHALVAEFLLEHGANVNAARTNGTTPLFYAVKDGRTNLVTLLLKRGAEPDAPDAAGHTSLLSAVGAGQFAAAELLVAAGAKVMATGKDGQSALHIAAKAGDRAAVEWLLNHGADPDAKDRFRMKPLDYVAGVTNAALVSLLEQRMKPRLEQALPMKVGEAGDPGRFLFEGLQTFTPGQIQHALAIKPSYLLAAHPQANMRAFLDALQVMIESGYQAAGFPDAKAGIRYDEQGFRVRIKVSEGPRFRAAKIHVTGAKSVVNDELMRWFTTAPGSANVVKTLKSAQVSAEATDAGSGVTWNAGVEVNLNRLAGGLDTPGKAARPQEPIWVSGDPADFSAGWATQAVAQVEACLAEQGFFFPKAKVELKRDVDAGTADLRITVLEEGPPGVVREIAVTGMKRHKPGDILRFLDLHEGMKITAERLAVARRKLRDCGRFWDFEITPEYVGLEAVSSRHVNLHIEVKEQDGVPLLGEPLSPVQQALSRMCEWEEQFPSRDEDIRVSLTSTSSIPATLDFVLSPRHGLMLNGEVAGQHSPLSAGFLLSRETVQLCAWASGNKLAAPCGGTGNFFMHLVPDKSGGSNHFSFQVGAGFKVGGNSARPEAAGPLTMDVQLSRAAFLDLAIKEGGHASLEGGTLVLTNEEFTLRADAATGRLLGVERLNDEPQVRLQFGVQVWDQVNRDFTNRSAVLTNLYTAGRGLSSLLAVVGAEAARWYFSDLAASGMPAAQRARALAALRKLLNPEILQPVDRMLGGDETNAFSIPMDAVDRALAMNSLAAFFSGFVFEWSNEMFPKYSWPWTAARETTFVMMSQGRYTDAELERLYNAEDTGPIGCLVLGRLLAAADSPLAKTFALQGVMRLRSEDFLRDCNLFLRGESGLARSFAKLADTLRSLPEEEFDALLAVLPANEAKLLRESATALRARPDAPPASLLAPVIGEYWETTLRAKVRAALYRLTAPPKEAEKRNAAAPGRDHARQSSV